MAGNIYSHAGAKFYISSTAQNEDLGVTDFEGLSYTLVSNVGSLGEYGLEINMINYPTWDTEVIQKAKGTANAGDPQLEVARLDSDAGQLAMRAAGASGLGDAYAFKIENQDGSIDYLRGLVGGPVSSGGSNEDFDLHRFNIALNQAPVHVNAST